MVTIKGVKYMSDFEAQNAIIDIGKRMYTRGFVAANDGNISCKVGPNVIWATPTGVSKGFMKPEMLVKLDLTGKVLQGSFVPSSEIKMHLRVYEENPKVMAVTHAHPPIATAFAVAGISLEKPILTEGVLTLGVVPVARYATPGTQEVPDSIAPFVNDYNAVLLSNHGALTWGKDVYEAFYRLESVEYYASLLMYTGNIIGKQNLLSCDQVQMLVDSRKNYGITSGGIPPCACETTNMRDVITNTVTGKQDNDDKSMVLSDKKNIMDYETVALDDEKSALVIIDQTKLPYKTEILELTKQEEIWNAIYLLQVRGAPAIGVAAAIGVYLAAKEIEADTWDAFYPEFKKAKEYLDSARPTAVNLSWALNRMDSICRANQDKPIPELKKILHDAAVEIKDEDIWVCKNIGEYGLSLVKPGDGLLTHCNAGKLATIKYGTATAPMYLGQERGYNFRIYADETRPLLQGARITAFELYESGLDVTLICDNMSATVMKNKWVDAVFVGCDRVAANGDTANKIGTSVVATVAKRYNVPFYVCAPTSTIDLNTPTGAEIKIEQRPAEEVTKMWYKERMAPEGVKVFNPCFDVTDNDLISGIITEYGIARAPYTESLKEIFAKKEAAKNEKRSED